MPNHVRNLHVAVHVLALLSLQVVCYVLFRREVFVLLLKIAEYSESPQIFMAIESIDEYGDWLASYLEAVLAHFLTARSQSLQFMRRAHHQSLDLLMSSEEQLAFTARRSLEGSAVDSARHLIRATYSMIFHGIESVAAIYRVTSSLYTLVEHLVRTSPYFENLFIAGRYVFALYVLSSIAWNGLVCVCRTLYLAGYIGVTYTAASWRWLWYPLPEVTVRTRPPVT